MLKNFVFLFLLLGESTNGMSKDDSFLASISIQASNTEVDYFDSKYIFVLYATLVLMAFFGCLYGTTYGCLKGVEKCGVFSEDGDKANNKVKGVELT